MMWSVDAEASLGLKSNSIVVTLTSVWGEVITGGGMLRPFLYTGLYRSVY